jgi:hypothetical protein
VEEVSQLGEEVSQLEEEVSQLGKGGSQLGEDGSSVDEVVEDRSQHLLLQPKLDHLKCQPSKMRM